MKASAPFVWDVELSHPFTSEQNLLHENPSCSIIYM